MDDNIAFLIEEAARILYDNPELKYFEAIDMAKEILKEKEPTRSPAK